MQLQPVILAPASWALMHLERNPDGDRAAWARTVELESRRLHRVIDGTLTEAEARAEREAEKPDFEKRYGCGCSLCEGDEAA